MKDHHHRFCIRRGHGDVGAGSAVVFPSYPSYDCAPSQYDSSGAPVAQYCD